MKNYIKRKCPNCDMLTLIQSGRARVVAGWAWPVEADGSIDVMKNQPYFCHTCRGVGEIEECGSTYSNVESVFSFDDSDLLNF